MDFPSDSFDGIPDNILIQEFLRAITVLRKDVVTITITKSFGTDPQVVINGELDEEVTDVYNKMMKAYNDGKKAARREINRTMDLDSDVTFSGGFRVGKMSDIISRSLSPRPGPRQRPRQRVREWTEEEQEQWR